MNLVARLRSRAQMFREMGQRAIENHYSDVQEAGKRNLELASDLDLAADAIDTGWHDVSAAPKDGSTVLFKIEMAARAYWDAEMKDWVLNYPINMECVRNTTGCALSTRPMVAEDRTEGES